MDEPVLYNRFPTPRKGERIHDILKDAHELKKIPTVPSFAKPDIDDSDYISLPEETVVQYFVQEVPEVGARLIAAGQVSA